MRIRLRLTFLFAAITGLVMLGFSLLIYFGSAFYYKAEFRERLANKARTTAQLLIKVDEVDENLLHIIDRNNLTSLPEEDVTVYDYRHQIIYTSSDFVPQLTEAQFDEVRSEKEISFAKGNREFVGILFTDARNRFIIEASAVDKFGRSKLHFLIIILALGWIVSVGIMLLAGNYYVGQVLQPILNMSKQVERISATRLNLRLDEGNKKDEFSQLASTFNKGLTQLEEAFALQRNFVAHASHEMRTPLTALSSQLEVSLMRERTPEEYRSLLQSLKEDVTNLTSLVHGLLQLARASSEEAQMFVATVRVDEVLWEARGQLISKHAEYNIHISFPQGSEDPEALEIWGNEPLLFSAFLNLMENGCKFSSDHKVDIELATVAGVVELRFEDNGVGLPAGEVESIFESFYRASNVRQVSGHGIGLALTRKIIDLHKGSLQVKSQVGKGSVFTVWLPTSTGTNSSS
jgi:signal transduction histidine kinase